MSREDYERQWYAKNEQAKERLRGISQTVSQMNGIANNVNVQLCRQGEQLAKINGKLDKTNHDIAYGTYIADGMKSFWTRMKQKITGGFKWNQQKPLPGGNFEIKQQMPIPKNQIPSNQPSNKPEQQEEYNEDPEIQSHLDLINQQLDSLKYAARMTGQAIDYQRPQIQKLIEKTDKNNKGLQKANKKIRYLADK